MQKDNLLGLEKNNDYIWLNGKDGNEKNIDVILEDWRK